MSSEYNGWTNYETWNIVLWINNDEGISDMIDSNLQSWVRREANEAVENCASCLQDHFVQIVDNGELRNIIGVDEAFPTGRTRDGVRLDDPSIDWDQIRASIAERLDARFVDTFLN